MIRAGLLALLACCLLVGCEREQPSIPDRAGTPALWVVDDRNGQTAGWLFGTIHALPDNASWQTPTLNRAVAAAGMLVVEVRDLDPARIADVFEKLARDNPGPPLAARLSPSARSDLTDLLEREDVTSRQFDGLETWAAALALARYGEAGKTENGADKVLLAQFAGRVRELEGAADQLTIFDTLPESDQRAMLTAVIAEQDHAKNEADNLAAAWLRGDIAQMEKLTRAGLLANPALYEALLARRNHRWMTAILPMLAQKERPMIAVGTAHLLGPDGLPAMLQAEGYAVRRIQ